MLKSNRFIYKETKKGAEPDPWIIPDSERVLYGMEQQLEKGVTDIIGQQGATSEAVRGVLGATTKTGEIVVDAAYPLVEVWAQTKEAYRDFIYRMPQAISDGEELKAVGYGLKAPGRILISPILGLARYPKRLVQMFYDGARAVGDLTGLKAEKEKDKGIKFGLHDKGLIPATISLARSVYNIAKTPFAPFMKGGKKKDNKKEDQPKEAPAKPEEAETKKAA